MYNNVYFSYSHAYLFSKFCLTGFLNRELLRFWALLTESSSVNMQEICGVCLRCVIFKMNEQVCECVFKKAQLRGHAAQVKARLSLLPNISEV